MSSLNREKEKGNGIGERFISNAEDGGRMGELVIKFYIKYKKIIHKIIIRKINVCCILFKRLNQSVTTTKWEKEAKMEIQCNSINFNSSLVL